MRIDLNADVGESRERWDSGEDVALLSVVTSANVCCGSYAGDEDLMRETCRIAVARGVRIGAQVGYRDRANFGRVQVEIGRDALAEQVRDQILLLADVAASVQGTVAYVKPHGALYNTIADDPEHAAAVVDALTALPRPLPLLGLPGSVALRMAHEAGLPTLREGFADRAYAPSGRLVPRSETGAVLHAPEQVSAQAVRLLGTVDSICVHSDTPGAVALARGVRAALEDAGAEVTPA